MSWQEYIDNNMMVALDTEGNTLASAALVGLDGSVWASSANFPAITGDEVAKMISFMEDPSTNTGSYTMGGVKFMNLASDDPETKLRGKCPDGGCAVSKTTQCLVIGIWTKPVQPASCNKVVETLAEYLVGVGY